MTEDLKGEIERNKEELKKLFEDTRDKLKKLKGYLGGDEDGHAKKLTRINEFDKEIKALSEKYAKVESDLYVELDSTVGLKNKEGLRGEIKKNINELGSAQFKKLRETQIKDLKEKEMGFLRKSRPHELPVEGRVFKLLKDILPSDKVEIKTSKDQWQVKVKKKEDEREIKALLNSILPNIKITYDYETKSYNMPIDGVKEEDVKRYQGFKKINADAKKALDSFKERFESLKEQEGVRKISGDLGKLRDEVNKYRYSFVGRSEEFKSEDRSSLEQGFHGLRLSIARSIPGVDKRVLEKEKQEQRDRICRSLEGLLSKGDVVSITNDDFAGQTDLIIKTKEKKGFESFLRDILRDITFSYGSDPEKNTYRASIRHKEKELEDSIKRYKMEHGLVSDFQKQTTDKGWFGRISKRPDYLTAIDASLLKFENSTTTKDRREGVLAVQNSMKNTLGDVNISKKHKKAIEETIGKLIPLIQAYTEKLELKSTQNKAGEKEIESTRGQTPNRAM